MALIGPFLAGCALLVAAGAAKAVRPGDTAAALAGMVPVPIRQVRRVVRSLALAEAALGAVAICAPVPALASLVAASYAGFAIWVLVARARGGVLASCGCFATPDTPATRLHAVVNGGVAVAAAAVAAAGGSRSLPAVLAGQPLHGLPLLAGSAACAWLAFHVLATLGRLTTARRSLAPLVARDR